MELVSNSLPNLINGVSQQPDALRLPQQAELQENCYSSVVEGLKERPPLEHIAKLYSGTIGDVFCHTINRDATHRYKLIIRNGALIVSDLAGAIKTVLTPDGTSYLNATTPSTSFRCVTVADYTFILNNTVTAAMVNSNSATRLDEGLIFVKQGNYGSVYKVLINGAQQASYTTSNTVVTDIQTDNIANQLATQLIANICGGGVNGVTYTITRSGSVIWVQKATGTFTLGSTDSQGGASLYTFKGSLQNFSQLPTVAPNGFAIQITPQIDVVSTAYYVAFVTSNGNSFDSGSWQECVAPGVPYVIDAGTMPYALVDNNDGTFTFRKNVWSNRTVGDTTTNPDPSFIGLKIRDIFFDKNRLGFAADDNIIQSEVGKYFNFFLTTVTTVVDSDRIDSAVSHTKVSLINHVVPFDTNALLFSDQTQFLLTGDPTMTSKTIKISPTTEFENSKTCRPVAAGRRVFFATTKGTFDGVREYSIDLYTSVKDAVEVTSHVPKYIPTGIYKMAVTTIEDCLAVLTTGQRDSVYIYKYFWVNQDKLQSSWSRIILGDNTTVVLDVDWIQTTMYVVVQRTDGVYLESMNYAPGFVDANQNYVTCLDRRITEASCTITYDAINNKTSFQLPFQLTGTYHIVDRGTAAGSEYTILTAVFDTLTVAGDQRGKPMWIGQDYNRRFVFSKFYMRTPTKDAGGSGTAIVAAGRLQLRTATILFANTGFFNVSVTPLFRDPTIYTYQYGFSGRFLGDGSNIVGQVSIINGRYRFPIMSKSDNTTIEINSTSFLPFRISALEWEGVFHVRSRRV